MSYLTEVTSSLDGSTSDFTFAGGSTSNSVSEFPSTNISALVRIFPFSEYKIQ